MEDDWSGRSDLQWGLFKPNRRAASDQIPMQICKKRENPEFQGQRHLVKRILRATRYQRESSN